MTDYKTCNGCKHLAVSRGRGYCQEATELGVYETDPTTEMIRYRPRWKYGLSWLENTTEKCRSPGMPCGPERRLYQPNFWRRLLGEKP